MWWSGDDRRVQASQRLVPRDAAAADSTCRCMPMQMLTMYGGRVVVGEKAHNLEGLPLQRRNVR